MSDAPRGDCDEAQARVFFALWPDPLAAQALHALACVAKGEHGGRVMREETLHLTLAFIGTVPRGAIADLRSLAEGIPFSPFTLWLDRIDHWKRPNLVCAGSSARCPELEQLAAALHRQLLERGYRLESRAFQPHVTLLRNTRSLCAPTFSPVRWGAREFVLVESVRAPEGASYPVLGRWGA